MPAEQPTTNWGTEEGLQDDFDLTVTNAYFATDSRYNGGSTLLLQLHGTPSEGDPTAALFACGTGWESLDGGKTAKHPNGKSKFNRSSLYGRFIDRMIDLGAVPELQKRGDPTTAAVWMGLVIHLKREEMNFGTGIDVRTHLMPTAWGFAGTIPAAAPTTPVTPAVAAAAPAVSAVGQTLAAGSIGTPSPKLVMLAKAKAQSMADYGEWLATCLELPGAMEDAAFLNVVGDMALLWAEVHPPA